MHTGIYSFAEDRNLNNGTCNYLDLFVILITAFIICYKLSKQ